MNLTDITALVRDLLKDPDGTTWSDAEIARYLSYAQRRMFKWTCHHDKTYYNARINLLAANARQVHANTWEYDLPRMTHSVVSVYKTTGTTARKKGKIPVGNPRDTRPGWSFGASKVFRLAGFGSAEDLTLEVCKMPARLSKGTCPAAGTSSTLVLQVDDSSFVYDEEVEPNAYFNSIFELTGPVTTGPDRDPTGQVRRALSSSRAQEAATTNVQTTVTVETAFGVAPAANDTYEMHAEVDDSNIDYLVLLATMKAFQTRHTVGGIAAIEGDLADEEKRFVAAVRERQSQEPLQWNMGESEGFEEDPDRAILLGVYGNYWYL